MQRNIQGQPKGLYPLFLTELWERFGFYTVQTILVLYMSHGMGLSDRKTYLLYGAFSSMLYLTPVIGGYIADRYIGFRNAIILGGILFAIGYAIMAIQSHTALFLGMSIVILANGFFKPNVSSMVGTLYTHEDPRREAGFTIFYMGINIGALAPPLFAGILVNRYGWNWGFLVASLGILIGLATFLFYQRNLGKVGHVPAISRLHRGQKSKVLFYLSLTIGILISIGVLHILFLFPTETNVVLIAASILIFVFVLYFLLREQPAQRKKLLACLILILISVGFWAIYTQTFTSLMLFADRNMSERLLGVPIDAEFMQFFNPFFILLLSPVLSRFWVWLDGRKKNPSTPAKFTWGLLFMTLGFLFLWLGTTLFNTAAMASPWWLVGSYFLQTIGELLLSPIGLSMITKLAPHHLVGMMMGVWFLTQSAAFAIGASLATLANIPKGASAFEALHIYADAFLYFALLSLALTALSFCLIPAIKKLMHPSTNTIVQTPKV